MFCVVIYRDDFALPKIGWEQWLREARAKLARSAGYSVEVGRQRKAVRLWVWPCRKIYFRGFKLPLLWPVLMIVVFCRHHMLSRFFELPIVFLGHFFASTYFRGFSNYHCCYEGCFLPSYAFDNFRFAKDRWGSLLVWHVGKMYLLGHLSTAKLRQDLWDMRSEQKDFGGFEQDFRKIRKIMWEKTFGGFLYLI